MKKILILILTAYSFIGLAQTSVPLYGLSTVSGTNTYTASLTPTPSLTSGLKFEAKFTNANTGASTLNINDSPDGGAVTLRKNDGTALSSGDIPAGSIWWVTYDGTAAQFRLVGGTSSSTGGTVTSVTGDGVDNTDPANPVLTFPTPSAIGAQSVDSDLTTIAGLSPSNDDIIQRKAGAWTNRTLAQIKSDLALNNVENTALSTWAGSTNLTTLGTIGTGTWNGSIIGLAYGGTNNNITADNGGIVYSDASKLLLLGSTATAGKILQSGASAAPSWSTPTYPSASGTSGKILRSDGTNNVYSTSTFADTYTASNLLYSNGANTVTGLATANNSVLVTNGSGVPSLATAVPNGVTATTQSASDNSTKIATTAYADAKVANAINNGTTAIAPAQDAVFDALALKQNNYSNFYIVSTISALQTYLAGLGAGVDVDIWFPSGSYTVTSTITISSKQNVRIWGEHVFIVNNISTSAYVFTISSVNSVWMQGLRISFSGNTTSGGGVTLTTAAGIVKFVNMEFLSFNAVSQTGVNLTSSPSTNNYPGVVFENCNFWVFSGAANNTINYNSNFNAGIGIKLNSACEYYKILGCTFSGLNVAVYAINGSNGLIQGNNFVYNLGRLSGVNYAVVYIEHNATNTRKVGIINNKFNHNFSYCISSASSTNSPNWIANNYFITNAVSPIVLRSGDAGTMISNNYFANSANALLCTNNPFSAGSYSYIDIGDSNETFINGNSFQDLTNGEPAIKSTGTSDYTVVKNNFVGGSLTLASLSGSNNDVTAIGSATTYRAVVNQGLAIGTSFKSIAPTAQLLLGAGTTAASTAPLKFTTGTSMTAAEAGAVEFTTDDLFFTITTGTARKRLLMADATGGLTSGRLPFVTTNGRLADASGSTFDGTNMVVAGSITTTANIKAGNHVASFSTTATAAGTTTLTVSSNYFQTFTGSTTQTVTLPVVTTLTNGHAFRIVNNSSGVVTVQSSGANSIKAMAAGSYIDVWVIDTTAGTGTASWNWIYTAAINN